MSRREGLTLIELLVVIAIVGLLIALLLPAVQSAREAARMASCRNNLKQIGLALQSYHLAVGSFPPGNINSAPGSCPGIDEPKAAYSSKFSNWAITILPYIEQGNLFDRYDFDFKNESPENQAVRETAVAVYACPSDLDTQTPAVPATGPAAAAAPTSGSRVSPRPPPPPSSSPCTASRSAGWLVAGPCRCGL